MKICFVVLLLIVLCAPAASALPRYALITGAKCASCHLNPTGGQLRTEFGTTFGMNALPMRSTDVKQPAATDSTAVEGDSTAAAPKEGEEFTFNPQLTENITVGGDFRGQFIYDRAPKTSSFQAMSMMLYGGIQLNKKVSLYFKQDIVNVSYGILSGPEVYSIIKPSSSWYIKGGIFLPDFGTRIDDHTAYTRGGDLGFIAGLGANSGLLFIPNYKDIGFEVGANYKGFFLTASLLNGTGNSRPIDFREDKAYAAKLEYMGDAGEGTHFRVGASQYGFGTFQVNGVHAGLGIENAALYGEIDWTKRRFNVFSYTSTDTAQSMAFLELDYRVVQGVWATGRYDMLDPQLGRENDPLGNPMNSHQRFVLGAEILPYSFVEIRPQYRLNLETPSVANDQLLVQFHYWY